LSDVLLPPQAISAAAIVAAIVIAACLNRSMVNIRVAPRC
jgi:hypothetical protein